MQNILAAGEWKSRVRFPSCLTHLATGSVVCQAVLAYLDVGELERDIALEAAMVSDEEDYEWID